MRKIAIYHPVTWILLIIVLMLSHSMAYAQLSGTKTIPGDYATISAAVTDLNTQGVGSGGVVFNIQAGQTYNETIPVISATGTVDNPIVFQKSGTGSNPVIIPSVAGTVASSNIVGNNGDGIIVINGGDYITFNGIDVMDNSSWASDSIQCYEYGYFLKKASRTDACKNITIANCNISLNNAKLFSYTAGIMISNISSVYNVADTVTSTGGRSENIKIYNNTITNCVVGVGQKGYAASSPYTLYDENISIGVDGGNTISIANAAGNVSASAINMTNMNNTYIANNNISGGSGWKNNIYGMNISIGGAISIYNNHITLTCAGTTSSLYGISNLSGGQGSQPVNVYNNTIENCTYPTATTGFGYYLFESAAGSSLNMYGNIVRNNSIASGYAYGIYQGGGVVGAVNIYNNTVHNISAAGSSGTIYGLNNSASATASSYVHDNSIDSLIATGGSAIYGLVQSSSLNAEVYNNTVNALQGTSSANIYGIQMNNSTTNYTGKIYKNKIFNLLSSTTSTSATLYGIYIQNGKTVYTFNNLISDIKAPAAGAANSISGISVSGGTTIGLYYNTIFLNAPASTGTNFGTSGIYCSTSPAVEMKDNVVMNISGNAGTGLTVAYRRSSTTLTSYQSGSNNNSYYAGTPGTKNLIFYDGTNNEQTISAFQTLVTPRDGNSFTEVPPFVNSTTAPYDLHISTTVQTQLESGGTPITSPIAITDDFDGDTRNATTPDIGADEFNGRPRDITPPDISYVPFANTSNTGNRNIDATITDFSNVNITPGVAPRIYYKKITDNNAYTGNTSDNNGWKWSEATNGSSPFHFTIDVSKLQTAPIVGDTIQYFIVAQDMSRFINVGINAGVFAATPTSVNLTSSAFPISGTLNSYNILGSLSGIYTVGSGMNYATITDAVADLNSKEVTGPVVFSLTDPTYPGEGFPIIINKNTGSSSVNTVTFKPAAGVTVTVAGAISSSSIFQLNGASYIVLDGSNQNGGTDRNLIIQNTQTTGTIAALWLASKGTGAGATNNVIKNCIVRAGFAGYTAYGIYIGGASLTTSGDNNDNNTILNNSIELCNDGIYALGSNTGYVANLSIIGNNIGPSIYGNNISRFGINLSYCTGTVISGNTIQNVAAISAVSLPACAGIALNNASTNISISGNSIHDVSFPLAFSYGGIGIYANPGSGVGNITLANNLIYGITGKGSDNIVNSNVGVLLASGSTYKLYYNSLNLYGTIANSSVNPKSASLYFGSAVTGLDLKDNIFANTLLNSGGSGSAYTVYTDGSSSSVFSTIDYNDYYANQAGQGIIGHFGTDITSGTAWAAATGGDANSKFVDPLFFSNTQLDPQQGSAMIAAGTPVSGFTTDYTGYLRNATTPTIGAYEKPQGVLLNLTVLLQGFYNTTSNTMISDTIRVYLHNATGSLSLVDSAIAVMNSLGNALCNFHTSAKADSSYYLQLKHRNSIETWSAAPVQLTTATASYDFTTSASKAFGNNLVLKGSKYCIYGGDVNQDKVVDISDMVIIDNDSFNFVAGYVASDVNGDGTVDISDMVIVDNNSFMFVGAVTPHGKSIAKPRLTKQFHKELK